MSEPSDQLVQRALRRDAAALRALVDQLHPVIQARVARVLFRAGRHAGRSARQEIDDLAQDTFARLFEEQGRALRAWDPARGLSLANFVGLLTERHVIAVLRSGRRSPWTEDPTSTDALCDEAEPTASPEGAVASRELLEATLERLRETLSPQGMHLFELLFVEERDVDEITRTTGLRADAIYAWRSRLRRLAQQIVDELGRAPAANAPEPKGETP